MSKDSLGDRMKAYEGTYATRVPPRQPTIIRVDGKAFHTWTKGLKRPWDNELSYAMDQTAKVLCEEIQTVCMAYVQSDEISLLLHPYRRYQSQPWFAGEVQKMVSISAAVASAHMTYLSKIVFQDQKPAYFDSRVFVVPTPMEASNYFLWRQQDALRNSVQMLARTLYSHKECDNKNCEQLKVMCADKGRPWENEPMYYRRGRCILKVYGKWVVIKDIPDFGEDREFVTSLLQEENDE